MGMFAGPRLRQVAVVAADCGETARQLQETFGWAEPFHDPGVGRFGLINAVFAAGDDFVEVVTPSQPDTTAGRYLDRRGGDSGYMAIFQVPDLAQARHRVAAAGVRVIWSADLADIAGTHLHPKDVPGAIVSLDWADPPESWRWAGPRWTGRAPGTRLRGGLSGLTIGVNDPAVAAGRWAQVLGLPIADGADGAHGAHSADSADRVGDADRFGDADVSGATGHFGSITVRLTQAGQDLRFVPVTSGRGEGITEVRLTGEREVPPAQIAGVRFVSSVVTPGG